jgi:hypothetical protein
MTNAATAKNTRYLDLDAVLPDTEVVVKLKGVEHKLVPITLADFVKNTKAVQNMAASADPEAEMAMVTDMLFRAFPSMTADITDGLTLIQLNRLLDFALANNGARKVEQEASKDAAENPTAAGQ